ncbi:MAG TPA: PDZ domain-containing protein [Gemmatimonadaceae bacterium]|nr:PDZ domain-containing protein [Gemmatimonadaceae bacterium]
MHKFLLALTAVATTGIATNAAAQEPRPRYRVETPRAFSFSFDDTENRAVIGITTSSGSARDTLGVLVSYVAPASPAEKAGIEEGNRLAAINGVNLKLNSADVDDWEMSSVMTRRVTRELGKLKPGDDVELRVYGGGQTRTVKLKTVAFDSLYRGTTRRWRDDADQRAALGISLGGSGSKRDTLGLLVSWVDDDGPALKAGLEEGNRIAAINNIDLRVGRDDAGDEMIANAKAQRLTREMEKLKPGDEVELRVYGDGRTRTVKVKTVAASTLSHFRDGATITLPRIAPMAPMPPMPVMPGRVLRMSRVTI